MFTHTGTRLVLAAALLGSTAAACQQDSVYQACSTSSSVFVEDQAPLVDEGFHSFNGPNYGRTR